MTRTSRLCRALFILAFLVPAALSLLPATWGDPVGSDAAARPPSILTRSEGRTRAVKFLRQVKGRFIVWRTGRLDAGRTLYDLSGRASAYLFAVSKGPSRLGYLVVSSKRTKNPIVEFSLNPPPIRSSGPTGRKIARVGRHVFNLEKPLYLGPLGYYVRDLDRKAKKRSIVELGTYRRIMGSTGRGATHAGGGTDSGGVAGSVGEANAGGAADPGGRYTATARARVVAMGTNYKVIAGVPDYDQYDYDYTSAEYNSGTTPSATGEYAAPPYLDTSAYASGCSPTAAGNIMAYWATRGYTRLMPTALPLKVPDWDPHLDPPTKQTYHKLINDLHLTLDTFKSAGGGGSTYIDKIGPGMQAYARDVGGYEFDSTTNDSLDPGPWTYTDYVTEINADRPAEVSFLDLNVAGPGIPKDYGGHSLTGVGFDYTPGDNASRYMLVRDNWPAESETEPADVYVQYGGNGAYATYSEGILTTLSPSPSHHIQGTVTSATGPASGVLVSAGAGGTAYTQGNGTYDIPAVADGTYTVTPSKSNWTFDAPSRQVVLFGGSANGVDFTASRNNTAPALQWTGESGYASDGVNPESGMTPTAFTYRVKYRDTDGDPPLAGYPKVHILKGGGEIAGSPFTMTYVSGRYTAGATYTYSTSGLVAGADYTYRFEAKDALAADATGAPTATTDAPDVVNPTISHTPPSLSFVTTEGATGPPPQTFNISNSGGGTLTWTASETTGWLSLNPSGATGTGQVTVTVSSSGLAKGSYEATITVTAPWAINSPAYAPVSLDVVDRRPPVTTLSATPAGPSGDNGWYKTVPELRLVPDETASSFYQWDATLPTGWQPYSALLSPADGQHTLHYFSADVSNNTEVAKSYATKVDTAPPGGSVTVALGATYSTTSPVELGLSATDTPPGVGAPSGVGSMRFSSDGTFDDTTGAEAWHSYGPTMAWTLGAGDGTKTVWGQFKDQAGNTSGATTDTIFLDTTLPPVTELTSSTHSSEETWYADNDPSFSWAASDTGSGVAGYSYVFDQTASTAPPTTSTTVAVTASYSDVPDGAWYFHVRAHDAAGNWGPTSHRRVRIDSTPPSGTFDLNNAAAYANSLTATANSTVTGASEVRFMAEDTGAAWGDWGTCGATSTVVLPTGDGTKTVFAEYRDLAGNTLNLTDTIYLDTSPPIAVDLTSPTHPDESIWYASNDPVFNWTGFDTGSGVLGYSYTLDLTVTTVPTAPAVSPPAVYQDVADGEWHFHVRAVDAAGNWGPPLHRRVRIDTGPPSGVLKLNNGAAYTRSRSVIAHSSVSDAAETRFMTGTAWGPWVSYAIAQTLQLPAGDGVKTVLAEYRDGAGNTLNLTDTIILDSGRPVPKAPYSSRVRRGNYATLKYQVNDATSPQATVTIKIKTLSGATKLTLRLGKRATGRLLSTRFRCRLPRTTYRFYIYATDLAGNTQSKPAANKLTVL